MKMAGVVRKCMSIFLMLLVMKSSQASYVIYNQNINSSSLGSVPEQESGFYYSDGRGNSISFSKTQNIPAIIYQYPTAVWVGIDHNNMPANAIILEYVNGYPVYHCRIIQGDRVMYGKLYPDQGCIISDGSMQTFASYEVLVR